MSNHFKTTVAAIAALSILLAVGWVRLMHKLGGGPLASSRPSTILKANDKEAVSYNSNTHILTVSTVAETKTEYTRNPVVRIEKDGSVKIERKLYGLEFSPFLGLGYGDAPRIHLGASWLYIWRLDLNTQVAFATTKTTTPFVVPLTSISYNFWRNTSLFVGTNPIGMILSYKPEYHVGIAVKF